MSTVGGGGGGTPTGPAGGDLTGIYPNPSLISVAAAGAYGDASHYPIVTIDSKGRVLGIALQTFSGGGGTTDHAALSNLSYAASGHTGFEPTVTKGNLTATLPVSVSGARQVIGGAADISIRTFSGGLGGTVPDSDNSTNRFLRADGGFATLPGTTAHDILSVTHSDTLADSVIRGDILYGNSTPKWARLAKGSTNYLLKSGASDVAWNSLLGIGALSAPAGDRILFYDDTAGASEWLTVSTGLSISGTVLTASQALLSSTHTDTLAGGVVAGDLIIGNATPKWDRLPSNAVATNKFLRTVSSGLPSWNQVDWGDLSGVPTFSSGTEVHNALSGLQGGTASEYYHLSAAQWGSFSGGAIGSPDTWGLGYFVSDGNTVDYSTNKGFYKDASNLYLYGGFSGGTTFHNKIYTATVAAPTTWVTVAGKTLPVAVAPGTYQCVAIGAYVYIFGGEITGGNTNKIMRATTADPTTWVDTGSVLPIGVRLSQIAIVGNNVYLLGGYTTTYANNIWTATLADPLTWSDTGATLPQQIYGCALMETDTMLLLYGGTSSTGAQKTLMVAQKSAPTVWKNLGDVLATANSGMHPLVFGKSAFLLGGSATRAQKVIYIPNVNEPWSTLETVQMQAGYACAANLAVLGNTLYVFTGYNTVAAPQNSIYSMPIYNYGHTGAHTLPWLYHA